MRPFQSKTRSPVAQCSDFLLKVAQLVYFARVTMSSAFLLIPKKDFKRRVCVSAFRFMLMGTPPCSRQRALSDLCLLIPYRRTAAALDALSELIFPYIGIESTKSHFSFTRRPTPLPSLPITIAIRRPFPVI